MGNALGSGMAKDEKRGRLWEDVPRDALWQADVFPSPVPMRDGTKTGFPPTVMVVHPPSRFILTIKVFPLGYDRVLCMAEGLMDAIERHGRTPRVVQVRKAWAELLLPAAQALGFHVEVDKRLGILMATRREMTRYLRANVGRS